MSGILKVGGSELINDNGGSGSLQWGTGVPAGTIIQLNQVVDQTMTERTGNKSAWELVPNMTCTLPNNLQSGSKLYASFSGVYGEAGGNWYACTTVFTLYQNSINIAGNQLSGLNGDHGLTQVGAALNNQEHWRESFTSSALFTPTGDATAKKTVKLYWKNFCTTSYSSFLNRAGASNTDYGAGATVLTVMEVVA